jgi:hypothetical protein
VPKWVIVGIEQGLSRVGQPGPVLTLNLRQLAADQQQCEVASDFGFHVFLHSVSVDRDKGVLGIVGVRSLGCGEHLRDQRGASSLGWIALQGEGDEAFEESWVEGAVRIGEGRRRVGDERLKIEAETDPKGPV